MLTRVVLVITDKCMEIYSQWSRKVCRWCR